MTALYIALWTGLALLVIHLILGWILCSFSTGVKRQSLEEGRKWQEEHYDISWYDPLEKNDYTVKSYDGYVLHAEALKNPAETQQYVLISHGYTDNRFGSLKYARMYLDLGFNVIIYDLRAHGLNEKTFVSYSVRESKDLLEMIRDARMRFPDMVLFGLHGESLGAATTAAVMKYRPEVDFAAADCGFSEIRSIMKTGLRSMHLPFFFVGIAGMFSKLRHGISFREMTPADALDENSVPMLFIHGEEDSFIPPSHSEIMQKRTAGYSELHLIEGAKHAQAALKAPEEYERILGAFIEKVKEGKTENDG